MVDRSYKWTEQNMKQAGWVDPTRIPLVRDVCPLKPATKHSPNTPHGVVDLEWNLNFV